MVPAFEKKSEPTMERAVVIEPENFRLVKKVTEPAITRHIIAWVDRNDCF